MERAEAFQQFFGLGMELLQGRFFDAVFAQDLTHDELGIHPDQDAFRRPPLGLFQPKDQGRVFGDVVGGFTDVFVDAGDYLTVFILEIGAGAGRAGIAAGSPVGIDRQALYAQLLRPFIRSSTSRGESLARISR